MLNIFSRSDYHINLEGEIMSSHITRLFTLLLLAASVVSNPSLSHAQITKSGSGYLVRIQAHPGEKIVYIFSSSYNMPASMDKLPFPKSAITMAATEKILKVTGDLYTIQMTMSDMKTNGKKMSSSQTLANQKFITKMRSDGQVVGGNMPMIQSMNFGNVYLKPIQIGHTYTIPISSKGSMMSMLGMKMQDKMTFVGFKIYHGIKTAEMLLSYKGTSSGGAQTSHMPNTKIIGTGTELLSVSDGWPVYMNMKSTSQMPGMGTGKMKSTLTHITMDMTMTRK